jgi:hypothetical protein
MKTLKELRRQAIEDRLRERFEFDLPDLVELELERTEDEREERLYDEIEELHRKQRAAYAALKQLGIKI